MNEEIKIKDISIDGKKITIEDKGKEVAHAYIYLIKNDLHEQAYAFLEDVYVDEEYRNQGLGKKIVQKAIAEAKHLGCKKIIGTSRYSREKVHQFYLNLGFQDYGKEFRIDF